MLRSAVLVFSALAAAVPAVPAYAEDDAVRAAMRSYVEAFNKHDAAAVASWWAANAVYVDAVTGQQVEGRKTIQTDFQSLFAADPGIRLSGNVSSVRMVTDSVASVAGSSVVFRTDAEPSESSFTAVMVRQGERWVFDSVRETTLPAPARAADALQKLEWMVGRWVDRSDDVVVVTTVRWGANRSFLIRSFRVDDGSAMQREGTQVIGWDPRARHIRSWSFNSDGSFGEGIWSQSGEEWLVKSSQTLADGRTGSGTFVMKPLDDDAMTVQLIGHEIEGEPRPASDIVTVARVDDRPPSEVKTDASEGSRPSAVEKGGQR